MDLLLFILLVLILFIRISWLYVFKTSGNVGYILPLIFECIFVYPYFIVALLGLEWSFFGLFTMYILSLSFQVGFLLNLNETSNRICITFKREFTFVLFFMLGIVYIGILSNHASTVFKISNVSQVLVLANQNAISRYDSTLNISIVYKISTIFSFLCALLLGTFTAVKKNTLSKLLTVAFFSILFLDSILMAARAGLLLQLSAFLSSYLLAKYVTNEKGFYRVSPSKVFFLIGFFSVIYAFFVIVQVARGGKDDFDIFSISSHVLTWFVGYLSAFDIWIKDYYDFDHSFGLRTFSGLADALNISQRSGGVYAPVEVKDGRVTNVYTAYRGLIEDFSLPLSIVIMAILGVIISKGINELILTRKSFYYSIVVMVIYFILWSFVINPYIYNTVLLAMVMFFIFNKKYVVFKKI